MTCLCLRNTKGNEHSYYRIHYLRTKFVFGVTIFFWKKINKCNQPFKNKYINLSFLWKLSNVENTLRTVGVLLQEMNKALYFPHFWINKNWAGDKLLYPCFILLSVSLSSCHLSNVENNKKKEQWNGELRTCFVTLDGSLRWQWKEIQCLLQNERGLGIRNMDKVETMNFTKLSRVDPVKDACLLYDCYWAYEVGYWLQWVKSYHGLNPSSLDINFLYH